MKRAGIGVHIVLAGGLCLSWGAAAWGQTKAVPQRGDIEDRYKWRLEDIYETTQAWEADFNRVKAQLPALAAMKGKVASSAEDLYASLSLRDSLASIVDRLFVFANMKLDEDKRVPDYQVLADKASIVSTEFASTAAFIEPEIVAQPDAKLLGFLDAFPPLAMYRHHLEEMLRKKAHTLSEPEERLLAQATEVTRGPQSIYSMLETVDLPYGTFVDEQGDTVKLTKERYYKYIESQDRRVRRDVNFLFHDAYEKFQNTFNASYSATVRGDIFYARARKYNSVLEMRLDAANIPTAVYENLIATVDASLEPYHRYQTLRKKVLKVDTLHWYDEYVPLVAEAKIEFSYEEAKKAVLQGVKVLGKDYAADLNRALESRWIDVYETQGKRAGAYNWGSYSTHPYILLNFNGRLEDMFTLGHELGHAIHGYYTHTHQPFVYGDNPTFTAEVASTTNEALIMNQLLKDTKDPEKKKYLLNYYIKQIQGTFYTQAMFSTFEHTIHQKMEAGEPVSAEGMRKIFRSLHERYAGPDVFIDPNNDMTWARISHFYRADNYYVYQYATSYAAGVYVARQILAGNEDLRKKYLEFLKTGASSYPVDQLKAMGVDLTTAGPVQAVADLFRDLVTQLEDLMLKP
jgi:oligoendopeptidase F